MADQINKVLDLRNVIGVTTVDRPSDQGILVKFRSARAASQFLKEIGGAILGPDAAAPAVPAVDALTRYSDSGNFIDGMISESRGEYVKLADVQALLAAPADPEQAKLDSLAQAGLAAALEHGLLQLTCEQLKARLTAADAHIEKLEAVARQPHAAPVKPFGYISNDAVRAVQKRGSEGAVRPCSFVIRAEEHGSSDVAIYLAAPEAISEQMGGAQVASEQEVIALAKQAGFTFSRPMGNPDRVELMAGNAEAHDRLLRFAELITKRAAPTTESTAGPADLSKLERHDHRGALMAPDSTGDYFLVSDVRDLLAKNRAAEGEATERKPLTDAELKQITRSCQIPPSPTVRKVVRAVEQHHGITGGGK